MTTDSAADAGTRLRTDTQPSAVAGRVFAAVFRALKVLRPVRPIHPKGVALTGRLERTGNPAGASGLDWLDSPGTDPVVARFSRSIGLPEAMPDILGLALRVGDEGADVLFASTGWRVPGRFLLTPSRDPAGAALTTLMPYRGSKGPVLLGLRTISYPAGALDTGDWVLGLFWATPAGGWRPCGELRLRAEPGLPDSALRFNPLENRPPGAATYPWARRLREASYRAVQRKAPAAVGRPVTTPDGLP